MTPSTFHYLLYASILLIGNMSRDGIDYDHGGWTRQSEDGPDKQQDARIVSRVL